ncbi:UDP-galactose transporter [Fulvia fulva]|nr:UDP-galactose transporter [Fulvia fulva]WPV15338.1 UDP-galactose transporter [Fulvia fulva]WPV30538.1 UDP-galactose transporter [Fulvia fulva]
MATDAARRQATLAGIPVRDLTLGALIVQNAALVLFMHYSRVMPLINGDRYFASTAVFLSEVVKFSFFISMALYEIATSPSTPDSSTVSELAEALSKAVFTGDSWKLAVPAVLFTIQNSLQYVAASNLDAATFAITYQLKIVSAAMFGILLMGRVLNVRKWLSLGMMAVGILAVQLSHVSRQGHVLSIKDLRDGVSFKSPRSIWDMEAEGNVAAGQLNKRSATYEGIDDDVAAANPKMNASIGLAAAVLACVLSGLACVYFERTLKTKGDTRVSIWVRNVQLSFYSIWPALFLGVFFMDGEHLSKTGFFTGYNLIVWVVIFLQAAGGILVAVALKYSDSLTKSLAMSVSTVITFLTSVVFLEFHTTLFYLLGMIATTGAAFLYNSSPDDKRARPPPINVTQYEKDGSQGYFDIEAVATAGKSPLRDPMREALVTSRPGTPVSERHFRSKGAKRGQ